MRSLHGSRATPAPQFAGAEQGRFRAGTGGIIAGTGAPAAVPQCCPSPRLASGAHGRAAWLHSRPARRTPRDCLWLQIHRGDERFFGNVGVAEPAPSVHPSGEASTTRAIAEVGWRHLLLGFTRESRQRVSSPPGPRLRAPGRRLLWERTKEGGRAVLRDKRAAAHSIFTPVRATPHP
jgi:hypothetical protein